MAFNFANSMPVVKDFPSLEVLLTRFLSRGFAGGGMGGGD